MSKKKMPRRLCLDAQTKYCTGHKNSRQPFGHRGCCECHEHNAGDEWKAPCNPYLLPEKLVELKAWWEENDMGPWGEDDAAAWRRPRMKVRGGRR